MASPTDAGGTINPKHVHQQLLENILALGDAIVNNPFVDCFGFDLPPELDDNFLQSAARVHQKIKVEQHIRSSQAGPTTVPKSAPVLPIAATTSSKSVPKIPKLSIKPETKALTSTGSHDATLEVMSPVTPATATEKDSIHSGPALKKRKIVKEETRSFN